METLVDTGAKVSCISEAYLLSHKELHSIPIKRTERKAFTVDGTPVVTLGVMDVSQNKQYQFHS